MTEPASITRTVPSRWQTICIIAGQDLAILSRSWLLLGFLLVSALVTVLQLKGLQAKEILASEMLEVVYATYLVVWLHAVIFLAGGALARERDCLGEAILSRGVTLSEYFCGKLLSRGVAIVSAFVLVLLPGSLWAIRQDDLVRTDDGAVASKAWQIEIEAWRPHLVYTPADGKLIESTFSAGDPIKAGDVLARLDDRELFDEFEKLRRTEENARRTLEDAHTRLAKSKRAIVSAEDAVESAKRAVYAAKALTNVQLEDRKADVRARERDLADAHLQITTEENAIANAEHDLATASDQARQARERLSQTIIRSPITGYVTLVEVKSGQQLTRGTHMYTLAPLDDYQLQVPVYELAEFQRMKEGLNAYVTIQETELVGKIARLSHTTKEDRWSRKTNFAVVRFDGKGQRGLLGRRANVRISLPPMEEQDAQLSTVLLDTITGHGKDDLETRTTSVGTGDMLIALGKVVGCVCLLVTLTLLASSLIRHQLVAIIGVMGLWHISNLLFDFAGLPELSYLEMVRTLDKVLGGVASGPEELLGLVWLFGIAAALGVAGGLVFVRRDPRK